MVDYAALAMTATTLIEGAGRSATLKRRTSTYSSATRTSAISETSYTVTVAILPFRRGGVAANDLAEESLIAEQHRQVIMAAEGLAIEPKAGDILVVGTARYTVLGSTPISPSGSAVVHKMTVKI